MKLKLFTITAGIAAAAMLSSCNVEENKQLRTTVDSLQSELQTSIELAQTLNDVGVLIDSIDVSRNSLSLHMVEGTSYANYTERLNDINKYVKQTFDKLAGMEATIKKSKADNRFYANTVKKLKQDLELSTAQLAALQEEVEKVRSENSELMLVVKHKDEELFEKTEIIKLNQQGIASLQQKVDGLIREASDSQAESYFKQAQALETAAERTKLAPRKKKATQQEALELYKLAATLGYSEAEQRITALSENI
ncbi:hypothetical protein SanaruYs_29180 [Chryseotalea sanaruensis]|uniref:Lipoprotein n=1 Tax=Chryseotalea sanaruensis TaxID=2482724 RepID=A0A401UCT0_9BACT|nr:hypothetical protein [Chryseotalea sanaruensis]GCC52680.1 hypothetical protein SanaruYs_29180 [Chryseotalea sanaruensis]